MDTTEYTARKHASMPYGEERRELTWLIVKLDLLDGDETDSTTVELVEKILAKYEKKET